MKYLKSVLFHIACWTFVLAGLIGCGAFLPKPAIPPVSDAQRAAEEIIWRKTYGRSEKVPRVDWRAPNCAKPDGRVGIKSPYVDGDGNPTFGCVGGATYSPAYVIVARADGQAISDTGLAHEFLHAAQLYDGQSDPGHVGPDWGAGGKLESARAALVAAGL